MNTSSSVTHKAMRKVQSVDIIFKLLRSVSNLLTSRHHSIKTRVLNIWKEETLKDKPIIGDPHRAINQVLALHSKFRDPKEGRD